MTHITGCTLCGDDSHPEQLRECVPCCMDICPICEATGRHAKIHEQGVEDSPYEPDWDAYRKDFHMEFGRYPS